MKIAFVVLGMHRSGTSSVAGTLARLGPKAPLTLLEPSADNPRGFWESRLVVALNDEILQAGGSYWRDWQAFQTDRIEPARQREFQEMIGDLLASEFRNEADIVLKDPRLCRLFAYWDQPLKSAGYRSVFVLPLRSPFEVAASLMRRNGMSKAECLLLWLRHVLEAEHLTRGRPRHLLFWDDFMADWRTALDQIAVAGKWAPDIDGARGDEIDAFLSMDLKHQHHDDADIDSDPESHVWLSATWSALTAMVAGRDVAEAQSTLDSVRRAMDVASDIYGRAFGAVLWEAHEANVGRNELAAAAAALEHQLAYLTEKNERHRDVIHTRDVRIGELNEYGAVQAYRADRAEGVASLAHAQLAACEGRIAELEKLADQQASDIAALERDIGELQCLLQARADEAATLQARLEVESGAHSALRADLRIKPIPTWWRLRREKR